MIKTIIFDLGRVIIPFDFQRGYDRMAPLCGYSALEIPERLRNGDLVTRFESGQIEPEAFVAEFSNVLNLNISFPEFCDIWSSIFLPETLIPEEMLQALSRRYRLLLLSNTNAIHWEMVKEHYPALRHFHDKILSFRVGALKPSPRIYEEALRSANAQPEECFYTDDIPAYVQGAKQHGIDAVQFQSADQIAKELRARGVEW